MVQKEARWLFYWRLGDNGARKAVKLCSLKKKLMAFWVRIKNTQLTVELNNRVGCCRKQGQRMGDNLWRVMGIVKERNHLQGQEGTALWGSWALTWPLQSVLLCPVCRSWVVLSPALFLTWSPGGDGLPVFFCQSPSLTLLMTMLVFHL